MSKFCNCRARETAFLLFLFLLPTSLLAQSQPSNPSSKATQERTAQEDDIREAALFFLFDVGSGPDPDYSFYCLSVDSNGFKERHDPSDALMKRFPRTHRTLRRFSECEVLEKPKDRLFGAIRDKQTGKPAWIISLGPIQWLNDRMARLAGQRYCGGLCGWSSTLQVTLQDGKWKARIAPGASVMVS